MSSFSKHCQKTDNLVINPSNPDDLWESEWIIALKESPNSQIGWISFKGKKENGTVPLSIELNEDYRNKGYGTEAIKIMTDWALLHRETVEVAAVSAHENSAFIYALEKSGYVYRGGTWDIENYSIRKGKTVWLGLFLFIGICTGFALGLVVGNMWVGMGICLFAAFSLGSAYDAKDSALVMKFKRKIRKK